MVLNKVKIQRRLAALTKIVAQVERLMEGTPDVDRKTTFATDTILLFMARPGGFLRSREQLADLTGVKLRTVCWVLGKARKAGILVRRGDARWSRHQDAEAYNVLTGPDKVDSYVLNEMSYRFVSPWWAKTGEKIGWTHGLAGEADVGGAVALNQSLSRLAKAGRIAIIGGQVAHPAAAGSSSGTLVTEVAS